MTGTSCRPDLILLRSETKKKLKKQKQKGKRKENEGRRKD
jgi:hypothetical protein